MKRNKLKTKTKKSTKITEFSRNVHGRKFDCFEKVAEARKIWSKAAKEKNLRTLSSSGVQPACGQRQCTYPQDQADQAEPNSFGKKTCIWCAMNATTTATWFRLSTVRMGLLIKATRQLWSHVCLSVCVRMFFGSTVTRESVWVLILWWFVCLTVLCGVPVGFSKAHLPRVSSSPALSSSQIWICSVCPLSDAISA